MAVNDMNQLLKHELGDLLYAERTFLKGLKKMSREISDPMMKERVVQHARETEEQIEVLGQAFESIGLKPRAEKCDAAIGLKEEHDSFKEDGPTPEILEAFNLGSGLRVEHYEIAGYRSAITLARALGFEESASLLQQNLAQEEEMAQFLESNAASALELLVGAEQEEQLEASVEPEVASRKASGSKSRSSRSEQAVGGRR